MTLLGNQPQPDAGAQQIQLGQVSQAPSQTALQIPTNEPQPTMQSINSYQQKQQTTQGFDIRNYMAMFLKSKEGQQVVKQFQENPDFGHLLGPFSLDQQDNQG